jgi:alpha-D-ribose 1-methylphosphonate 5-triphosphate synthase subunit PhnI
MVSQFAGSGQEGPKFTRGYGLVFGYGERKAMSMALVDRALRAAELGEAANAPANDHEFVLYHSDNVEASGFTQHLKLPHYVDFQTNLELVRRMRADRQEQDRGGRSRPDGQGGSAAAHDGSVRAQAALDEAVAS